MSNDLANKLIKGTLSNTPYVPPVKAFLALYTSDPTKDDTGSEVGEASYSRQEITMGEPVDGVAKNTAEIEWNGALTSWGTVGWVGIRDAATEGNLMFFTALDEAKDIGVGDQFKITANSLTVTLS